MKNNSIEVISSKLCTGCGACKNICPFNAICMDYDDEGFWKPKVIKDKCNNCGLCIKTCPAEDVLENNNPTPLCFACVSDDQSVRKKSSSGGIFGLLADYVREHNGYVCGAAYNERMELEHVIVRSNERIDKLYGSKYLQSNTRDTFKEIKKLLESNENVLFCGTPCQVAGLNKFLKKKYDKLITADLLCHGGSSPLAFQKYLKEYFPNYKITNYTFREKTLLNVGHSENVYTDNKVIRRIFGPTPYFAMFRNCISVMNSCGTCKASKLPRQGDFTLGDAWGIDKVDKSINDTKGVSIVSVNNIKAEKVFNILKGRFKEVKEIPLDWVLTHGQPMNKPFKVTSFRHKRFFDLLRFNSFNRSVSYTNQGKFDVAIMGVWYGANYGSILTYFSLYSFLSNLGLLTLMVEKMPYNKNDTEVNPKFHSRKFALKHYKDRISHPRNEVYQMSELNNFADTFIVGSDQVFHKNCLEFTHNTFLLNFVETIKKKISFSSSFGHHTDSNPIEKRNEIRKLFKRFDHIGLREESGVQILKDNYNIYNATTVVDAIFLNNIDFYKKIALESDKNESEEYILTYILDPQPQIASLLSTISETLNLKLINILDGRTWLFDTNQTALGLECVRNVETEDFLYYFLNAKYVITDSYHGTCFSILFKKQFITLANKIRGLARFETILNLSNLSNRMVMNYDIKEAKIIIHDIINYDLVYEHLQPHIDKSKQWLKDSLFAPKQLINEAKYPIEIINEPEYDQDRLYVTNNINDSGFLYEITNLKDYLRTLNKQKTNSLILISVRDTVGLAMNKELASLFKDLGIITELENKHWHGFIAVIDNGNNIFEECADNSCVQYIGKIDDLLLDIDSKPFKKGNISRILINGVNYSLNRRGFNIVVFNKELNQVIDRVSFDTHDPKLSCVRVE